MRYSEQDIEKIVSSVSTLDYFQYLEKQGRVQFEKKAGGDYYFRTENNKFSVNDKGYYDFKTGQGGQIVKAVMNLENKNWIQSIDFLKDFSNTYIASQDYTERREKFRKQNENRPTPTIERSIVPNNEKLIAYFQDRGIDKDVLKAYTKQVHYKVGDKKYFGIGLQNQSEGYEIRNPMMKTKLGASDISIVQGTGKNAIVFEGMADMLSFVQLQRLNGKEPKSTMVVLNSVVNEEKFVEKFKDFKGKITLLLDGDSAGNHTTQNIIKALPNAVVEDARHKYGIKENGLKDLNDYLLNRKQEQNIVLEKGMRFVHKETGEEKYLHNVDKDYLDLRVDFSPYISKVNNLFYKDIKQVLSNYDVYNLNDEKLDILEKSRIFTKDNYSNNLIELTTKIQEKNQENERTNQTNQGESTGVSTFKPNERGNTIANDRGTNETSQSERGDTNREPKELDSHNVGNGLGTLFGESVGRGGLQPTGSTGRPQQGIRPTDTILSGGELRGDRQDIRDNDQREQQTPSKENDSRDERRPADVENANEKSDEVVFEKGMKLVHKDTNEEITFNQTNKEVIEFNHTTPTSARLFTIDTKDSPKILEEYNLYDLEGKKIEPSENARFFIKDTATGEIESINNEENKIKVEKSSLSASEDNILEEIKNLKGQKVSNEQITEIVNALAFVDENKQIGLKEGIEITDDIKDIIAQFKSGGTTKEGRGILDEYYTDSKLVEATYNLIKDKFQNPNSLHILEPSIGVGNFVAPTRDLGNKSQITGFEINENTAKIAKILHPNVDINLRSFETEFINDIGQKKPFEQKYDIVVGNPPYGEHRGLYKGLGEEPKITKYEDYFVKRSLDVMKEGGTLAMVLPSGWLNRQNKLNGAELSQAYRLPSGAFKDTQIGTDIIILKKNSQIQNQDISKYFEENTAHILGEKAERSNRFGKMEEYVKGNLDDALQRLDRLQNKVYNERVGDLFSQVEENIKNNAEEKEQNTSEKADEKLLKETLVKVNHTLESLNAIKFKSPNNLNSIHFYESQRRELEFKPENFNDDRLKELGEKADKLTEKLAKYQSQSDEYRVQNTPEIKKGVLKYHFQKEDETVATGLQNSSNITERQVEAFRNTHYDGVIKEPEKYQEFANYYKGDYIHDFYYAEGDIYEKLDQLEQDKENISQEQYEKQKALLESVLPQKKELEDIIISPNQEFVHNFILGQREKDIRVETEWDWRGRAIRYENKTVIEDVSLANKFKDFISELPSEAFGNSSSWEVREYTDNKMVTGRDKDYNALIRERRKEVGNDLFDKFLREELDDETKNRFVDEFNRKHNNIHIPNYKEFPLFSNIHKNFKGRPLELTEVQKAGIGRLTTKGVGLLAHEVGFGKTLSGILSMHEAMERGNAKRPLIVVPNDSILKQWVETIYETIPNAKVNVLGNLGKNIDLSKFDNKDGEISLVTYEGFNNIGFSNEIVERLSEKFSYISENETKVVKTIEKEDKLDGFAILEGLKSEREKQIEEQKQAEIYGKMRRGKIYDWEDFGFDHLTFDEAHNANHIVGKVRIDDRKYASDFRNQNQATSLLGMNTWVVSQYIQEQNDGRNVNLLSATPFTNKPLEYYSILSLIANDRLEKSGYFNVNTFFETFMEADNDMEIDAKGDIKYKTNVRRFKNNALFQQLLGEFIDIKGEEDNPELKRPNRINKEYKIEQNDLTKEAYERLNKNFNESQKGAILTHILNARLIAMSPYLAKDYDGETPTTKEFVENSPKLKTTMDLITQNKKDQPNAGQIIYSELGVAEFPKLKEYLVDEVGYKSDEVGIITGATSKNQRLDIQEKFNEGKIKIVIGSEAIQEGMNLQKKTSDMYLLSLPYNFTSLRQTEGRAWRQGNEWENVRINFMLTNDSIDVFMLQKLQAKQARYMEAMKKGANIIDISDVDTQELKTAIITSPITRANIEIDMLRNRYESEKTRLKAELGFVSRKFEDYINSKEYIGVKGLKSEVEYSQRLLESAIKNDNKENISYWTERLENDKKAMAIREGALKQLENKLLEKGIDISTFRVKKEQTESQIEKINEKISELPELKEKLIAQYQTEKEEKLKNYNPVDFVKEREQENKTFYKLRPDDKAEKIAEEKTTSLSALESNEQDKPRGFRR